VSDAVTNGLPEGKKSQGSAQNVKARIGMYQREDRKILTIDRTDYEK
jgi:hypothetical protein